MRPRLRLREVNGNNFVLVKFVFVIFPQRDWPIDALR